MSDKWVMYQCQMGEGQAFIRVDSGLIDRAPIAALPHNFIVKVPLRHAREDGLPGEADWPPLRAFEERLETALSDSLFVGAATGNAERTWYFYTDDPERDAAVVRTLSVEGLDGADAALSAFEDAAWEQYREFLYPNKLAWRYIYDLGVLDALAKSGDDGHAPRTIDHWAYFPTRKQRRAYIARITEAGYQVEGKSTRRGDERPFGLHFATTEPMAPRQIFPHSERLTMWADELGGEHDGWETPVLRGEEESPS